MIAMSAGTSMSFLQAYTGYCSLTRMPKRHRHKLKQPCMDALSYKLLKDCKSIVTGDWLISSAGRVMNSGVKGWWFDSQRWCDFFLSMSGHVTTK